MVVLLPVAGLSEMGLVVAGLVDIFPMVVGPVVTHPGVAVAFLIHSSHTCNKLLGFCTKNMNSLNERI